MDQPNSPVNTINVNMQDEFASVLDQIENDANIRAAVLISKKSTCFVAGADIDMINKVIKKKIFKYHAIFENGITVIVFDWF